MRDLKIMREIEALEKILNQRFSNSGLDLTIKVGFASKEVTVQNLDHVFVRFEHLGVKSEMFTALYRDINSFNNVKMFLLILKIQKLARQFMKDMVLS